MSVESLFLSSLMTSLPHTPYTLQVRKQYRDSVEVIISGELDATNAEEAFENLIHEMENKKEYNHINCDFSKLTYTNSTTLAYLTDFIARTHRKGKTITFKKVHPKTQYIFDMVGLSKVADPEPV